MLWLIGFLLAEGLVLTNYTRERVATNSTYAGTCALSPPNGRRNIATFTMRARAVNINILFRGYDNTTPFTIALEMPTSNKSEYYSVVSYTTTLFGSVASQMRSPANSDVDKFTYQDNLAVFRLPFAQRVFKVANESDGTWYSNAKSIYKRHWPTHTFPNGTQIHYGPYPAQRFMTTVSYKMPDEGNATKNLSVTSTAKDAIEKIRKCFSTNYGDSVFDVSLSPAFSENESVNGTISCTVTIPLDYDIGWDAWAVSLSAVVGISAIILVSIFKCCPCACILRLYDRTPKETCESLESTMVLDQTDRTAIESAEITSSPPGERAATR
ncbi:hypothetical protein GMRT_10279 [Giardia muris]|uniref:Uncharacterized protein n=1 Tax=Giardia muris TaxID=5742 RepID=A0A4Z1TA90_GIAMU|nr:hypothetical protein GMRT_10279 [Giardia muris]|eukprot:TNJ29429.1 hypothetical protein GMRT_10279 [Giardia muris]